MAARGRVDHNEVVPVSYTHLDVYKRQALPAVARVELRRCYGGELGLFELAALATELEAAV